MKLGEITVFIIVKSNNDRYPGKNMMVIELNKNQKYTLLELKIKQLLKVFTNTQILVSSNSDEYLDVALKYNLRTHKRDEYYCKTETPLGEVLINVCSQIDTKYSLLACVNYPLMGPTIIKEFLNFISINESRLSSGVVCSEEIDGHFWFADDWLNFRPGKNHKNSQDVFKPKRVVWGLSAKTTSKTIEDMSLFNDLKTTFEVPFKYAVDINHPEDLELANILFMQHSQTKNNEIELI